MHTLLGDIVTSVQTKMEQVDQKRWAFVFGNKVYSVRAEADKFVKWVNRFTAIGDVAVNADPVHAGLPWALIRLLLQVSISSHEQLGALLVGLERATYALNRVRIHVDLYLDMPVNFGNTSVKTNLEDALVNIFARIMKFLAEASSLVSKKSASRMLAAIWSPDDILSFEKDCTLLEQRVESAIDDFDGTLDHARHEQIVHSLDKCQDALGELSKINDSMTVLVSNVEMIFLQQSKERVGRILQWVSPIPYSDHHDMTRHARIAGTGEWLLHCEQFRLWSYSRSSMILWLHGIRKCLITATCKIANPQQAGAGKTMLISRVIDEFLDVKRQHDDIGLAYFYCKRSEDNRRLAISVLQSFVKQLGCCRQTRLHEGLTDMYENKEASGFASNALNMNDVQILLKSIMSALPATTLIIDGLDECHEADRAEIIRVANELIKVDHVKILISSRRNDDIKRQLRKEANVGVEATDNSADIRTFILKEVWQEMERRERLEIAPISDVVREAIVDTLYKKSRGMYVLSCTLRLASTNTCKVPVDRAANGSIAAPRTGVGYSSSTGQSTRWAQDNVRGNPVNH